MFTRRATLGILGGLASDSPTLASCVAGTAAMMKIASPQSSTSMGFSQDAGWRELGDSSTSEPPNGALPLNLLLKSKLEDQVVAKMLKKTPLDMQAALRVLAD